MRYRPGLIGDPIAFHAGVAMTLSWQRDRRDLPNKHIRGRRLASHTPSQPQGFLTSISEFLIRKHQRSQAAAAFPRDLVRWRTKTGPSRP